MRLEIAKYLFDIQSAASLLATFVDGRDWDSYQSDPMLRAAVERQFEIIGEALSQLRNHDAAMAERISEHRRIVDFRNRLIHGYADIDDALVWDVVQTRLGPLRREVDALLRGAR